MQVYLKWYPSAVPESIGGAAGWVGGLGAFGGFLIPPLMGLFVDLYSSIGFTLGFILFVLLSILCLGILGLLNKKG